FSATHFIGRRTELGQLKSGLEQALLGKGGMYVVMGEPGIGKTRLIQELGLYGRVRGARVLTGHCTEDAGAPPYLPILEAMDSCLRDCPTDQIRQLLGSEAPLLIRLFPQLATHLPDLKAGPTPIGEVDRYVLFQAVASVFRRMAEPSGLLLLLEDLHWASPPSLLLLHHLGRQLRNSRMLVVGTYRDVEVDRGHPLVNALVDLRRERLCERIPLRGLSLEEVRLMIGPEAPEQLARAFLRETEGNPLFIGEILRHLTEEGRIGRDRGPEAMAALSMDVLGIPEELREVIRRRLSRLSVETCQMLTLAAAIGTSFRWEIVVAASGEIEEPLLDPLDQALAAQIVRQKGSPRSGTYEFTHALIRHTLYSDVSTPRRARLHKQIGEAMERVHRNALDPYLAELAHHYYEAATAGGAEKALECSARAGDRAISVLAYEDAAAHYARALEMLDGVDRDARARSDLRADIHAKRGMAFAHIGSWEDGKLEFEAALAAIGPDRKERRAEVLVDLAMVCFWAQDVPALRRHASEALELAEAVEREDLAVGAQGALAAAVSADDGKVRESIHGLRKALARADRPATGPVARGLQMYSLQLYWVGDFQEAIAVAREAAKTARAVGDAFLLMAALPQLGLALSGCGRYGEALEVFEEARRFGREHRIGGFFARAIAMSAGLHFNLFDDGRAEELIREARELALSVNFSPPALNGGLELLRIHARREEIALGEKLVGEVAREVESAVAWHGWLWKIRFAQGRAELALARRDWEVAHQLASDVIARSRATGRVKYAAEGHLARARALDGLRQGSAAAAERKAAVGLVRQMGDPAALVRTAAQVVRLEDDPVLEAEARQAIERIAAALPDAELRRRFQDAEPVRSILR
ncbi:MAG TPA: AAA family ATPase, partial [Myxococcaceae bacterium]|nr:AAA family ATPase [Myxococcaceae bacterium]